MTKWYGTKILWFLSFFLGQSMAHAEDGATPQFKASQTYSMKDLAVKMTSEEVEVLAEEIQVEDRLVRKITWEGKQYFVGMKNPQDSTTGAPGSWECMNGSDWDKMNIPRGDKTARAELGAPIAKKVKIYAETLRTTCPASNKAQARPRVEDTNVGIKTGDATKGSPERRLFVNPKENSFNFSTSF